MPQGNDSPACLQIVPGFTRADQPCSWKVSHPGNMVTMKMRKHNGADIRRLDAVASELRDQGLLWIQVDRRHCPVKPLRQMPRGIDEVLRIPGVEQDPALPGMAQQ